MAGHPGENLIADAIGAEIIHGPNDAWQKITVNVEEIDEYRMAFDWIIGKDRPLHNTDIGNTLSQLITYKFRATDSPFDQYLNGKEDALSIDEMAGIAIFMARVPALHAIKASSKPIVISTLSAFRNSGLAKTTPMRMWMRVAARSPALRTTSTVCAPGACAM